MDYFDTRDRAMEEIRRLKLTNTELAKENETLRTALIVMKNEEVKQRVIDFIRDIKPLSM